MAYVDGLLVSNETVIRREQQHWVLPFYIAGKWVGVAVAVTLAAFLVNWILVPSGGGGILGGLAGLVSTLLLWVTIIALVIAVVGFAWSAARWRSQEYVLTSQRVIHVRGVFTKESSDSVLESLTDAQIRIPLLGRVMGWGNLVLMTANEAGNQTMLALRDPVEFKKAVLEAKSARTVAIGSAVYAASGAPATPPAAPAAPPPATAGAPAAPPVRHATGEEVTRTLTALAGLRDSGAITDAEFEAKKRELLDRI